MEPLQRVEAASRALGKLAAHSAAAGGSVEAGAAPRLGAAAGEKLDLVTLLRLREQIKQQLMEYNTTVHAGEESIPDQAIEEKLIEAATEDLEKEMEQVKVSFQNKTLVLQRIQLMDALRTKLRHNDGDSKLILETIKHIIMLSTAILESQQQARELEEKLNEIKKRRFALKQDGEHKLLQIHTLKKKQKEELEGMEVGEMLKRICRNLQKETQMTTLIQNIFQSIIIGSKVNWAEDPVLKAIVLQLEKNVNCI
ncbi:centromere protein H [Dermochelys coriacea]|uniref:centromere protein H n=1 Tax=Dermochelys coriacea TaxID=27794 RepID=UPI0018E81485|nr:centromere protein H [Dermochelys coriacea]